VAGGAIAAGCLDLLHDGGRSRHAQPAATVLFRDQRGEEPCFGERRDEFAGIGALAIESAPVFAGKLGAERPHRLADLRELLGRLLHLSFSHLLQTASADRSPPSP
jgi:hypothetical protein